MNKYAQVEQLLSNYKMLEISIRNMKQEIEYIEKEDGMTGISYDGISTSPTNQCKSATEGTALSNMEKIHWLEHSIERATRQIESVDRALEGLEDIEKQVIIEKYMNSKQWWQVGSTVRYSESWCKQLRAKAIKKLIIGIYGIEQ